MHRRLALGLVVLTVATLAFLAFGPGYRTTTCDPSGCVSATESLLEHEGPGVLLVLAVPLALVALLLVLGRRGRIAVAVVLTVLALLGAASIGLFLLPVVAGAWWLAYRTSARSAAA